MILVIACPERLRQMIKAIILRKYIFVLYGIKNSFLTLAQHIQ